MNIAVVFAGGTGQRMKSGVPKQFLEVYGKPILIHTLEKFQLNENIDKIYIACKEEFIPLLKKLVKKYQINKVSKTGITKGGATGQDSIFNGLQLARKENPGDSIVLLHDGVRPLIKDEVITNAVNTAKKYGSAITCTPSYETPVISLDGEYVESLPERKVVYTAQAPQAFILDEIVDTHKKTRKINPSYEGIIDSCTLMKQNGKNIRIIVGNKGNIKVTTPEDYFDLLARLSVEDQKQIMELMENN